MSSPTMSQKFTAEIIGTAILVFIGAGSVPLTVFLTGENPFGSSELSTISFCFAFAIFAAVYAVGHISGAHINPAVTIALLATRKIDSRTAGVYVVAQVIGAIVGAILTYIILIGNDPVKLGLGAVTYNPDTSGVSRSPWRPRSSAPRSWSSPSSAPRSTAAPRLASPGSSSGSSSTGSSSWSARSPVPRSTRRASSGRNWCRGSSAPRRSGSSSPSTSSARSSVA